MTCDEAEVLLHALIDGELDAGHAREVEAHVQQCQRCARSLRSYREMRAAIAGAGVGFAAPAGLRRRIEAALPGGTTETTNVVRLSTRRSLLKGLAFGSGASMALAASVAFLALRRQDEERMLGDVLSAHLRSLQADHLTDVLSTDQHTVKPWFNGKLDVAPPVVDLTSRGFTLIGGRLDFIDGKGVAAIVYKRRAHVINLFVMPKADAPVETRQTHMLRGFNMLQWSRGGLTLIAISDLAVDELNEFGDRFDAALATAGVGAG